MEGTEGEERKRKSMPSCCWQHPQLRGAGRQLHSPGVSTEDQASPLTGGWETALLPRCRSTPTAVHTGGSAPRSRLPGRCVRHLGRVCTPCRTPTGGRPQPAGGQGHGHNEQTRGAGVGKTVIFVTPTHRVVWQRDKQNPKVRENLQGPPVAPSCDAQLRPPQCSS